MANSILCDAVVLLFDFVQAVIDVLYAIPNAISGVPIPDISDVIGSLFGCNT